MNVRVFRLFCCISNSFFLNSLIDFTFQFIWLSFPSAYILSRKLLSNFLFLKILKIIFSKTLCIKSRKKNPVKIGRDWIFVYSFIATTSATQNNLLLIVKINLSSIYKIYICKKENKCCIFTNKNTLIYNVRPVFFEFVVNKAGINEKNEIRKKHWIKCTFFFTFIIFSVF